MSGTRKLSEYIAFARRRVFDTRAMEYRFDDSYYIDGLNQAIAVLFEMRPEQFGVAETAQLTGGVLQDITGIDDQSVFLGLTRNMGTDGTTPGPVIRKTTRSSLDGGNRNWPNDLTSTDVIHFFAAPHSPRHFYVWPPQPATGQGYVEHWIAKHPTTFDPTAYDPETTVTDKTVEDVEDRFFAAIGNFMAAFVLQTDDEDPTTNAKVDRFMNAFNAQVVPGNLSPDPAPKE